MPKCNPANSNQTEVLRLHHIKKIAFCEPSNHGIGYCRPMWNEIVKAIGKFWHVSCFTCTTCNKPIQPPYFFEKEGKPYCNDDYAKNFAPICKACGQYIFEDYLKVLGGTWHTNCFTCKDCKQPIKKKYFLEDKKQICATCMTKQKNKKKMCPQNCCSFN